MYNSYFVKTIDTPKVLYKLRCDIRSRRYSGVEIYTI